MSSSETAPSDRRRSTVVDNPRRTYDRTTYESARAAWDNGTWGSARWDAIKAISWERGFPYPPTGEIDDDPEAMSPSRRAIIALAMKDRPTSTTAIVMRSRSWTEVVGRIIEAESILRAEIAAAEYLEKVRKLELEPSRDEAARILRGLGL